jgi:hypothetical protein
VAYKRNGREDTDGVFFKSKKVKEVKGQQNFVALLLRRKKIISYRKTFIALSQQCCMHRHPLFHL